MLTFYYLSALHARNAQGGLRRRGGNSSADLFILYNTNFMNKFEFNYLKKIYQKINDRTNFLQSTKSPQFPLRGKVVQLNTHTVHFTESNMQIFRFECAKEFSILLQNG